GAVVDEIAGLVDEVGRDDVDAEMRELLGVADVLDVRQRSGLEVVDADHAVPAGEQLVAEMRAEEPGAAGDQAGGHREEDIRHMGRAMPLPQSTHYPTTSTPIAPPR